MSFNNYANILGMAGVWSREISIVYGLWIQFCLNQSPKCFWKRFTTLVWNFLVCSQSR